MTERTNADETTYEIEFREGSEEHVLSTIKKYYGGLLVTVQKNPNGRNGVLLVKTSHELPADAFARIVEVNDVTQI